MLKKEFECVEKCGFMPENMKCSFIMGVPKLAKQSIIIRKGLGCDKYNCHFKLKSTYIPKYPMNAGKVEYAIDRALQSFHDWNDCTGCFPVGSGYYGEIQGCIEDAVHAGIQTALFEKVFFDEDGTIKHGYIEKESEAMEG